MERGRRSSEKPKNPLDLAREGISALVGSKEAYVNGSAVDAILNLQKELLGSKTKAEDTYPELVSSTTQLQQIASEEDKSRLEIMNKGFQAANEMVNKAPTTKQSPSSTSRMPMSDPKGAR